MTARVSPVAHALNQSTALLRQAQELIPCQTQCLSKGPTQFVQGVAPAFLSHGKGSHVWDVDGNEYIDYMSGLGPIILGYNHPVTNEAIRRQLEKATTLSLNSPLEVEVAELLREVIPSAEMVRFGKNGSDATSAAVRIARAYTGREHIAQSGYHGWQDWYVVTTSRNRGIPAALRDLVHPFEYNDLDGLERILRQYKNQLAAVIMEPVLVEAPRDDFLRKVKECCEREGILLIYDEVITGFRWSLGGAQEYFGVTPDIACFGKSMTNGMPLSAVVGRKEVMKTCEDVFFSLTYGGECLSLAAAQATVTFMRQKPVIEQIWNQGRKLQDGFNALAERKDAIQYVSCIGYPVRTVMRFLDRSGRYSLIIKSLFQQEVIKRGILFAGYHNLSFSHTGTDIEKTLEAYGEALDVVKEAAESDNPLEYLQGPPVQNVFRPIGV
ncbi:MAG TPA: aminotransferase class III-fold pyridoxal phosphate-dependent enzyme [Acidobacteriota bacterium]|nr:aminotransferase class III-fold pyridoxal phosphate-dependent enzyme [Acidobacteriota bacterium]